MDMIIVMGGKKMQYIIFFFFFEIPKTYKSSSLPLLFLLSPWLWFLGEFWIIHKYDEMTRRNKTNNAISDL